MTEDVLDVMRDHDEPFMTLPEIAENVEVTKGTVYKRLQELVEEDRVYRKTVGAKAVIWWLPERYQPNESVSD